MNLLVLSDSHSGLSFMRAAIRAVRPDAVVHLGDYCDDAETMQEEFSSLNFHIVPGNCDRYRSYRIRPELLCYPVGGVMTFMTHGHNHRVKTDRYALLMDARKMGAGLVLYGHTHEAFVAHEDGLWIMNPGACGSTGGSVGLVVIEGGEVQDCRILRYDDLSALK